MRKAEDNLIDQVGQILHDNTFNKKNVLENLKNYNASFTVINEDEVDKDLIFSISEIKKVAISYRLRFIDTVFYKHELPYECVLKIDYLNSTYKKEVQGLKVLSTGKFLKNKNSTDPALLFSPTNLGNYYLLHDWGKPLKWSRAISNWPLRNIETLFLTLIITTLIITLCLPTYLITLDRKATYWCAYRIGVFFHLFIFNMGVTAYITFAFSKNLSTGIWNSEKDFG
ncbi:MAG: hypothetical protein H0W61_04245 [Bacteroidetes bacterium]|nr:hypothetical protein [Bacteroidota bacterium]